MNQPFNYTLSVPNPAEAVTAGLQQGVQLAGLMERADLTAAQRQQTLLENQALQAKAQLQANQQAAVKALYDKPSAERTADDYERLSATLPKEQAENIRASFDAKTKEQQRQELLFGGQVFSALRSGDRETANSMLLQKADAARNGGDEVQAKAYENAAEMAAISPQNAETFIGTTLSVLPGGKEFIETVGKQQTQQFEANLQPIKERKLTGEAQEAEVKGKYAEKVVKSEIKQREASAAASMAAAKNSIEAARLSLSKATTEEQSRAARVDLLKAQAELARGKLAKAMGNPADARAGALHTISVIDSLMKPERREDIDAIFGAAGLDGKPGFYKGIKLGAFKPDILLSENQQSVVADIDTLGGSMFLQQAQKMRGLGQLTENEGKKILAAAGNLTRQQSPDRLFATLTTMREVLAAGASRKAGAVPGGTLDIGTAEPATGSIPLEDGSDGVFDAADAILNGSE
jgi:hypothetical protein